jgi:hypothetical protein
MYQFSVIGWVARFLYVQLFLTLVALPILVGWGLPIAYLSPIGTFLFSPLLSLYLCCAIGVFGTTILHIPNTPFVFMLEQVSRLWLWLLSFVQRPFCIGFVSPPYGVLAMMIMGVVIVAWYVQTRSIMVQLGALNILFVAYSIFLCYLPSATRLHCIHKKYRLDVFHAQGKVLAIDMYGLAGALGSADRWIMYHALPEITRNTGAVCIDHYILMHPRKRAFEALTALCEKGMLRTVYMPAWQGRLSASVFCAYKKLTSALAMYGGQIHLVRNSCIIQVTETMKYKTVVTTQKSRYDAISYPILHVACTE